MNTWIFINSKTLGNLLKRCNLTLRGNQEIIKAAKERSSNWLSFNRLAREKFVLKTQT